MIKGEWNYCYNVLYNIYRHYYAHSYVGTHKVKSNYEKYAQVRSTSGKTGREVAEEILHANGIYDVDVVKGEGFLTDHYDPKKKVVCLSPANFDRLQ